MLLNNDYYLDLKTSIMSQEISSVVTNVDALQSAFLEHISNDKIHSGMVINYNTYVTSGGSSDIPDWPSGDVIEGDRYYTYHMCKCYKEKLYANKIVYLPITKTASELNKIIREVPHDLNSYTLIFVFVIPDTYIEDPENPDMYVCDVGNNSIAFDNFKNGTLIVLGEFLHDTAGFTFDKSRMKKDANQISNPVKYDGVNLTQFIAMYENELENPIQINDIIDSEDADSVNYKKLNKIIIRGTALNENYSLLTFYDVTAKTYLHNLAFASSLSNDEFNEDVLVINKTKYYDLPSLNKLVALWPFDKKELRGEAGAFVTKNARCDYKC